MTVEQIQQQGQERMLNEFLNLAELMLLSGAEVYRVEDTICRMGRANGATRVNAFVITSSIVVTMAYGTDFELTQTRRITESASNDFIKLEQYNSLSRRFCAHPMNAEELAQAIAGIVNAPRGKWSDYIGSICAAGGFAVFFGGNIYDGIAGALFGIVIAWISSGLRKFCPNTVTFNILCSFTVGTMICLIAKYFPVLNPDKIMIGDIMLLIPGVAFTVSVRDVLVGDTISGILRLIESVLWAAGIAYGFLMAIMLIGG